MRKILAAVIFFALSNLITAQNDTINWMTWDEAMQANEINPKKKLVDVYTDWCGFCKKMDATTLKDPELIKTINENFYPIKFNAEQKEPITFNGFTYNYIEKGRTKYHQLAQSLLNGKLGYPSFLLLDEDNARIHLSPGYKDVQTFDKELEFAIGEHYKNQSFSKFRRKKAN